MIFWIFVILTVVCIGVIVATNKIKDKYDYHEREKNTKLVDFAYRNDESIYRISGATAVISGIVIIYMLIRIIVFQTLADGERASNEQTYNSLVYKSQTEAIRDEFGIVNKEYIDEVQAWNEYLAKYQSYSHNFWIGIFYPKRAYDGFEFIDLESIRMKD
jgi:hypothetical protein